MGKSGKYNASVNVILQKEDSIFMFKRRNTGWEDDKYTVPSGHIDDHESPTDAAIREAKEEAGVTIKIEDLELVHVDFVKDSVIGFTFLCKRWSGELKVMEPDKAEDGEWFRIDNPPEEIAGHGFQILKNIEKGKIYKEVD